MTAYTPGSAPGPTLGIEYGEPLPFTFSNQVIIKLSELINYLSYYS